MAVSSFRRAIIFWWGLFLVMQVIERLFLIPETIAMEAPTAGLFAKVLAVSIRADLTVATMAVGVCLAIAGIGGWLLSKQPWWPGARNRNIYRSIFMKTAFTIACALLMLLTADMAYYLYNHRHLDYVFFEYFTDLVNVRQSQTSQASSQTQAELSQIGKWAGRVIIFISLEAAAVLAWIVMFKKALGPALSKLRARIPSQANVLLALGLIVGGTGLDTYGPWAVQRSGINSSVYYGFAQNPIWLVVEVYHSTFHYELHGGGTDGMLKRVPLDDAVRTSQQTLGAGTVFPYPEYPFVHPLTRPGKVPLKRPPNILVILIEGLDRRFLNRTISPTTAAEVKAAAGISVTPFMDRLKTDSVYFENFFANSTQTFHGMAVTLCSDAPRFGQSSIQALFTHDYLCLPSVLKKAGYWTEMVTGMNRDDRQAHNALFMARNGVDRLFDENDFPAQAKRVGLGKTDGDLFDMIQSRLRILSRQKQPFFLATITASTHHPYHIPLSHPEVKALADQKDQYIPALRYVDAELERMFENLRSEHLLDNTVVFILGDHGRHEEIGPDVPEQLIGHFMSPLFVWVDHSLRTPLRYRPRSVSTVASQADLTPTILGLTGLMPRIAPFLGRDISCLLASDCLAENTAFLSSVRHNMIGWVDRTSIMLYSVAQDRLLYEMDLDVLKVFRDRNSNVADYADKLHLLLSYFVSTNVVRERNQVWSWKELGQELE